MNQVAYFWIHDNHKSIPLVLLLLLLSNEAGNAFVETTLIKMNQQ